MSVILEKAFAVLVLFLSTGALLPLLFRGADVNGGDGNLPLQMLWALIHCTTLLIMVFTVKDFRRFVSRDKALLLLLLLATVSVLWSAAPSATIRRSFALLGTSIFGIYLGNRFSLEQIIRLLAVALAIAAVFSLIIPLIAPTLGVMQVQHAGAWRGAFVHKNHLGRFMSFGTIVFLLLAYSERRRMYWIGSAFCFILVLLSTSKAAVLTLITIYLLIFLLKQLNRPALLVVPILIIATMIIGPAIWWLTTNYQDLLALLGRDATLTGRTSLWLAVITSIFQRPWYGYGYGGFWNGAHGASATIWLNMWDAPHAHNGYLEVLLHLGVIGLIPLVASFVFAFGRSLTFLHKGDTCVRLLPITFLMFIGIYNVGESLILIHHNLFWILYIAITLNMATRMGSHLFEEDRSHAMTAHSS